MKEAISKRVKSVSDYMIETKKTIRQIAKEYKMSKSTIHKDLTERLLEIDKEKYEKVTKILEYHIQVRHIRGGESTRKKYKKEVNNVF